MITGEPEVAVDALLARLGKRVACGTPLGLGKPVPLLNALYARARSDPQLQLSIFTALSLEVPGTSNELERRFLAPFAKRMFEGVPQLDYLRDLRAGRQPANFALNEFYFRPGAMLGVAVADSQRAVDQQVTYSECIKQAEAGDDAPVGGRCREGHRAVVAGRAGCAGRSNGGGSTLCTRPVCQRTHYSDPGVRAAGDFNASRGVSWVGREQSDVKVCWPSRCSRGCPGDA